MTPSAIAPWTAAWLGGTAIGVANGILREKTDGRVLGARAAHQVSSVTAIGAFAAYCRALEQRRPIATATEAAAIGGIWVALTVGFEFSFGRLVAKQSWEELLAGYDVSQGRTWPLVLAWIGAGPAVVRAIAARAG